MKLLLILSLLLSPSLLAYDIPQELIQLGFTHYTLVDYHKEGCIEYFTFSDWRTEERGDTITFVVEGGKVKKWYKGEEI